MTRRARLRTLDGGRLDIRVRATSLQGRSWSFGSEAVWTPGLCETREGVSESNVRNYCGALVIRQPARNAAAGRFSHWRSNRPLHLPRDRRERLLTRSDTVCLCTAPVCER